MVLSCRYGDFVVPEESDLIIDSLRYYGEWAQEEIDLLSTFIRQGDVVVDAGAYIGTHCRAFSSMVGESGTVLAFEPNTIITPFLKENALMSSFNNINIHEFALGEFYERKTIVNDLKENKGGYHLVVNGTDNTKTLVEVKPLDSFNINRLDFIKADLEGMELAFLKGAARLINTFKPLVFVEANSLDEASGVLQWACSNKYNCYGVISNAYNPNNFNQAKNNIFGQAKECGLLLISQDDIKKYETNIKNYNLPKINTVDELALLLLNKPQYVYEVLEKSTVANVHGIYFPSPALDKQSDQLSSLNKQIDEMKKVKEYAEQLAFDRLSEIEKNHKMLVFTQKARDEAEQIAFNRLLEIDEIRKNLEITNSILERTESKFNELENKLNIIESSIFWRIPSRLGLTKGSNRRG